MKAFPVYDILPLKPGMWAVFKTFRIGDPQRYRQRWIEQWRWTP